MPPEIRRLLLRLAATLPLATLAGPLAAQDSPPAFLQVFREEVKVGRGAPHVAAEAGWPRAFAKAGIKNYYLAMTSTYGPQEAWFLEGHESVAEIDQVNKDIEAAAGLGPELDRLSQADAANISSATSVLLHFHPELSNPGSIDVAAMRVWEVLIFYVRPGHENDFIETAKLYKSTVEQAKIDMPWATYAVAAGMPSPTFLVFLPHRELAEIDPSSPTSTALQKAFTEESMKRVTALSEGYQATEDRVFTVSPEMSYMSPEFVARDPKFWGRKATAAKAKAAPAAKPAQ